MHQAALALSLTSRLYLRNTLFVVLLVVLPPTFITLSFAVTPDIDFAVNVPEAGRTLAADVGMATLHGAIMAPMTIAFLGALLGLFVMLTSREGDRRLVASGFPLFLLLAVRLTIIAGLSLFITAVAVGVTLLDFEPPQLGLFFLVNLITALQYAFIGAIAGTFLSAMGGTYLMFFLPMIDLGLVQNPMFTRESVVWWVQALPGYGVTEVLVDVSFSQAFDTGADLAGAMVYLAGLIVIAALLFWRTMATGQTTGSTR